MVDREGADVEPAEAHDASGGACSHPLEHGFRHWHQLVGLAPPTAVELAIVAALTLLLFAAAVHQFSRPE